jgi:phosphoglycerate dehydrogenase-like enzyme
MKKAYCVFENFSKQAQQIIRSSCIDLTMNTTPDRPNGEELIRLLNEYDILIIGVFSKLTADMIQCVKKPMIIATLSIGLDHIDKVFSESPLVTVVNIKLANTVSVAEHIFALILALNKRIYESNYLVLQEKGHRNNVHQRTDDISNKTLGLIGAGNITHEVIKIAKIFSMRIKSYTKNPEKHQDLKEQGVIFTTLDDVLKNSDIINVSIPLNEETEGLISKEKIQLMKPTATFINTSRTEIVDTEALIQYADLHDTFYVGLDIDIDNYKELFSKYRPNVIVTPHTAGISKQAIDRMDLELTNKVVEVSNTVSKN